MVFRVLELLLRVFGVNEINQNNSAKVDMKLMKFTKINSAKVDLTARKQYR